MNDIFTPDQRAQFDFPVERETLKNRMGKDTGFDNIFNAQNGNSPGVVSRDYNLITHKQAVLDVLEDFDKAGLPKVEPTRIETSAAGSHLFATFRFITEFDLGLKAIEKPNVGDLLSPGFQIINSYDRSYKYSLNATMLRLVCTNGMTVNELLFGQSQRHTAK